MNTATLDATEIPSKVKTEAVQWVAAKLNAGYTKDQVSAALAKTMWEWNVHQILTLATDAEALAAYTKKSAEFDREQEALDTTKRLREKKQKAMEHRRSRSDKRVWRRVTDSDPSLHGSQYLGREGEYAYMPSR